MRNKISDEIFVATRSQHNLCSILNPERINSPGRGSDSYAVQPNNNIAGSVAKAKYRRIYPDTD